MYHITVGEEDFRNVDLSTGIIAGCKLRYGVLEWEGGPDFAVGAVIGPLEAVAADGTRYAVRKAVVTEVRERSGRIAYRGSTHGRFDELSDADAPHVVGEP